MSKIKNYMDTHMPGWDDPNSVNFIHNDWLEGNQNFVDQLCLRCGLNYRNYDGLCNSCKEEAKNK